MVVSSMVLLACYVLLVFVIVGCADGRIGINAVAGIRTPTIMANQQTWLAGHKAAKRPTIAGASAAIVAVVPVFFLRTEPSQSALVGLSVALMLIGVIVGAVTGTKAARSVLAEQELHHGQVQNGASARDDKPGNVTGRQD